MPRRAAIPLAFLLVALLCAAVASAELSQKGTLRISFDGDITPRSLPRDHPAPVTLRVSGKIGTTDGSQPPPVQRIEIALNRAGRLSTLGLPACTGRLLQSTSTDVALERCRPALVGHGHFSANVQFPTTDAIPANGRMLAFFGLQNGRRALFLHLYITSPAQVTFVLPLIISKTTDGPFGTLLSAKVPRLAGGLGSVTGINLTVNRQYTYKGQRRSFLSASCAAPSGFTGGIFTLAQGRFHFAGGESLETTLTRNCKVR
jgi:hypothetical protein